MEASNRLEDVVSSKDFKLVEMIIAFLEHQSSFYEKCSELAESEEQKIQSLKTTSEQKRTSFYEHVKIRHQKKQETSQKNEDEKYDELVRLLSSPKLDVVNAICLSAGIFLLFLYLPFIYITTYFIYLSFSFNSHLSSIYFFYLLS